MTRTRRLSFWALQAGGWCGLYALAVVASLPDLRARGVWPGIAVFVGTLFLASILLRRAYGAWWTPGRSWLALAAACVSGAAAGACLAATGPFRWLALDPPPDWSGWPLDFTECFVILALWSTLYFSLKGYLHAEAERERAIVSESEARRAQLMALRSQLNPHFLFNALNGVSTLIVERDNAGANRMLTQICALLRASMRNDGVVEVALCEELALVDQYLDIERSRLTERFRFDATVEHAVRQSLVPAMLLQPLVENAVHHGIAPLGGAGTIRLAAFGEGDSLCITIENPMPHQRDGSGHGIGLGNTRKRLETLYGPRCDFVASPTGDAFRVAIRLPLQYSSGSIACAS